MALPSSGALSFSSIAGEMGISAANSLSYLSQYATGTTAPYTYGLGTAPHGMSEFFGFAWQSMSYTQVGYRVGDPCGYTQTFYMGSDGKLYEVPGTPADGLFLYVYSYYDYWEGYIWDMYFVNSGVMNYYGSTASGCGNW